MNHIVQRGLPWISILSMLLLLMGCRTFSDNPMVGSGTDQLPPSACTSCDQEPFYQNGVWVKRP